jgi:two-component system CheB/CheR fusion protein
MSSSGKKKPAYFPIVCIGGSAGSLSAYRDILRQMPEHPDIAIVIISHRSRSSDRLVQILARDTCLTVVEATDGMSLKPNFVFVAPAHREITTDGVTLRLAEGLTGFNGWPTVISDFLFSLASGCTSRAIAIIVSGMGHDGSAGLIAVKRAGGQTFAQSDAFYHNMPEAAIDTEYVDFISSASIIGKYLATLKATRPVDGRTEGRSTP